MCSDIAISVRNLTKNYRIFAHPADRIKQALTFGTVHFHDEFTALADISFEIKKGEAVGIIGRNGSGKSTLLQLICGILKPTSGEVQVNGRISALLELGSGFNPEFTGRENVYFQGAVMGLTRVEMEERFDDITSFADIGEFIDQPVRIYSSGMVVRLAFAVAIQVDPDILVVDEALSVGDILFQAKCFSQIRKLSNKGTTLLFVSHSISDIVKHCSRTILLDTGALIADGQSGNVANLYMERLSINTPAHSTIQNRHHTAAIAKQVQDEHLHLRTYYRADEHRWGSGEARILDCAIYVDGVPYGAHIPSNASVTIRFKVVFDVDILHPVYGLLIKSHDGIFLYSTNSKLASKEIPDRPAHAGETVICKFTLPFSLNAGGHLLSFGVSSEQSGGELVVLDRRYDAALVMVTCETTFTGLVNLQASFELENT